MAIAASERKSAERMSRPPPAMSSHELYPAMVRPRPIIVPCSTA
jgi:hypothetical protein